MITLGKKIQILRTFKGLSQKELAQNLVSRSMITLIEGDKATPSTDLLIKILRKLDASIEEFLENLNLDDMTVKEKFRLAKELVEAEEYWSAAHLLQLIEATPNPITKTQDFKYYQALCQLYKGNITQGTNQLEEILAQETLEPAYKAQILFDLAKGCFYTNNLELAELYCKRALPYLQMGSRTRSEFQWARIDNLLGIIYARKGLYAFAVEHFNSAYEKYGGNLQYSAGMLANLGIGYKNLGEFQKAQLYFHKSLSIYKKLPVTKQSILTKFNYGVLLSTMPQVEEARRTLLESLNEFRAEKIEDMAPVVYSELARLELKSGKLQAARDYVLLGMHTSDADHFERPYLYQIMGEIYFKKDFIDEAIEMFEAAIPLFEKHSRIADLLKVLPVLSCCYEKLGDVEKAVTTLERSKVFMNINSRSW